MFRAPQQRRNFATAAAPMALTGQERVLALDSIPAWVEVADRDAIQRSFVFQNFNEAWGFMSRVALCSEQVSCEWIEPSPRIASPLSFP